jgi:eukaryotic-like serine/threonine-protein kinase
VTVPHEPPPDSDHPAEASIFGLPIRDLESADAGRDPIEKAVSEFVDELRRGLRPPMSVYLQRYPQYAAQLRDMLPLAAAMESWKLRREFTGAKTTLPDAATIGRLGNCRIVREIGRGGMGVVYEAVQEPEGQRVAVKLLPGRFPADSLWRQRFYGEAQTSARLRHHHIVPVYSFGEQEGWCYYVMQLVEGLGLDRIVSLLREPAGQVSPEDIQRLFSGSPAGNNKNLPALQSKPPADSAASHRAASDRPRDTAERIIRRDSWWQFAKIGMQVAAALRYAHSQGIVHCDIKPANLLLDHQGSMWIADFGIAVSSDPHRRGESEQFAGTLAYLAPEQLAGQVDRRTDVYSLGATLYELCTLTPPFSASDRSELLELVRRSRPARPRHINRAVPPDLERIILKAMAGDPKQRFQSADDLVAALRTFLESNAKGIPPANWLNPFSRLFSSRT